MDRLLQVDRIIGVYHKTEFCGLHFSKISQNFIEGDLFYYIFFHRINLFWGSWSGLNIWVFLLYLLVQLYWQLSRMEILFFSRNNLFSRHSCSRWFNGVGTCFEKKKMHTSSMPWCIMEMPTCHEIDDTQWQLKMQIGCLHLVYALMVWIGWCNVIRDDHTWDSNA